MTRQPASAEHRRSLSHPGRLAAELLTAAAVQYGLSRALFAATGNAERREVDEVDRVPQQRASTH